MPTGAPVTIAAKATIVATGGLTRLYRRNSASANMGGDGYALALRAGAPLVDMEFVQFFPIGHLAPRLIGMDPIMWDPFRYKLGGRLLNRDGEEFTARYGVSEDGRYVITRDVATYAIVKEVEAGRGSPHGGAFLSFEHCSEAELRAAFGPVIDRLAKNNIDLTRMPIEVAPIAHYHMGGVVADERMETEVPGLLVAGEAVGGANGANRLSGNAITEALVFGRRAGRSAAERVRAHAGARLRCRRRPADTRCSRRRRRRRRHQYRRHDPAAAGDHGGRRRPVPHRHQSSRARSPRSTELSRALGERPAGGERRSTCAGSNGSTCATCSLVARTVTMAALARTESRGAHQREDFPGMLPQWRLNQVVRLGDGGHRATRRVPAPRPGGRAMRPR